MWSVLDLLAAVSAVVGIAGFVLWIIFLKVPNVITIPFDSTGTTASDSVVVARWNWAEPVDRGTVRWFRLYSLAFFVDALGLAFAAGLLMASTSLGAMVAVPAFAATAFVLLGLVVYLIRTAKVYGGRWRGLRIGDMRR